MNTVLRSNDLNCPSCIAKIEKQLKKQPGVSAVEIRFNTGRIMIEHQESADPKELAAVVESLGYRTEVSRL